MLDPVSDGFQVDLNEPREHRYFFVGTAAHTRRTPLASNAF